MSKISKWLNWFYNHRFEIALVLCLIFIVFYIIFKKRIDEYLKDKSDFELPKGPGRLYKSKKIITKKNETRCRRIFEDLLKKPFPSVRPQFLKRSNGRCLELDGYNKELNLAFEYNGVQHYKFSPKFHKTEKDFREQIQRDIDKRNMCYKHNVTVIEIPYNIKYENLESYIKKQLGKLGYDL